MRQLHIFSIKPKLEMRLFVSFCVLPRFSLNLPDLNRKLLWTSNQNNFWFKSGKFREKQGKTQNSSNNRKSSFGLTGKNMKLPHIYLSVPRFTIFAVMSGSCHIPLLKDQYKKSLIVLPTLKKNLSTINATYFFSNSRSLERLGPLKRVHIWMLEKIVKAE